jgi:hypothetical protein
MNPEKSVVRQVQWRATYASPLAVIRYFIHGYSQLYKSKYDQGKRN